MVRLAIRGSWVALGVLLWAITGARGIDQTVTTKYVSDDGQTAEILGIGQITPERMVFWNPDGKLVPELTKRVKEDLELYPNHDFTFSANLKNRYILLKIDKGNTYIDVPWLPEYDYIKKDGTRYVLARIIAEPKSDTASFEATIGEAKPRSTLVRFRPRATAKIGDVGFKVVDGPRAGADMSWFHPSTPGNSALYNGAVTDIFIETTLPHNNGSEELLFTPLDAKKNVIDFVDAGGNPLTKQLAKERDLLDPNEYQDNIGDPLKIARYASIDSHFMTVQGLCTLRTNVSANKLSWIRISIAKYKTIQFTNIRLDPLDGQKP